MRQKDWLEETLDQCLLELSQQEKNERWFSVKAIFDVPYIQFPGFSKQECLEVQEQIRSVLMASRNENNYNEVAITYKRDTDRVNKKYCKVLGDYSSVLIMNDEDTRKLLHTSNEKNELVVLSIHNHSNNSRFSLSDLFIFTENPSIKLMLIVNGEGEVSFLLRDYEVNLHNVIPDMIICLVPNFVERKNDWIPSHQNRLFKFADILTKDERKHIVNQLPPPKS